MLPTEKAIVMVLDMGLKRSAALVYRIPGGVGWIEPEYFEDQPPSRSPWHEVLGEITETDNGALVRGADQVMLILDAERVKGTEMDYPEAQRDFAELEAKLRARGSSLAEQRILLAPQVGASG